MVIPALRRRSPAEGAIPDPYAVSSETEQLRTQLETERSAGRALIAAVTELDARLGTEQATSQALLTKLRELEEASEERRRELEVAFQDKRAELRFQREDNARLRSRIRGLERSVAQLAADRSLWQRLRDR